MNVVAPGNEVRIFWRRVPLPQNCCGGVPFSLLVLGLGRWRGDEGVGVFPVDAFSFYPAHFALRIKTALS